MRIRKAVQADVPRLTEIWKEFIDFNARYQRTFRRTRGMSEKWAEVVEAALVEPAGLVLVAVEGSEIVGFCTAFVVDGSPLRRFRQHGFIRELAVAESHRRRGVATRLFRRAEAWFVARGIARAELHIASGNPASKAFWEAMGFRSFVERMGKDY